MAKPLREAGPDVPDRLSVVFKSHADAIKALQSPDRPVRMPYVALRTDLPAAADYPQCGILCGEINSLVVSTLVTGAYAWLRADGGAL